VWALLLVVLTSWPSPHVPAVQGGDKLVHALLYGVLAFLVFDALRAGPATAARRAALVALTIVGVSAFGWADEWHQQFIPGRSRDNADWLADTLGAAIGAAAGLVRPARHLA
jgi:VanZ family protein